MPIVRREAKPTLTAVELAHGDVLEFRKQDGNPFRLDLLETGAEVIRTTLPKLGTRVRGARTDYRFFARVGTAAGEVRLEREVSTPRSFYAPWEIDGVRLWLDAVGGIFAFLSETHGECRPRADARLALQDAALRICPERLRLWCPLPHGRLRIEDCFRGEDCWLGAFDGESAHGGLDINHPRGTPLYAPLDCDDHFYFNSVAAGHNNNRWRGLRRWPDGAEWILQAHHMVRLLVPERGPLPAGTHYAEGAGVYVGLHEHSHFAFRVHDLGETIFLDPWILFWQMLRDAAPPPAVHGSGESN